MKQRKISSAHEGGAELSRRINIFLGRTDLRLEASEEGYIVLRRGEPARQLSEGEKTAIGFLHFVVQLRDRDFNLADGLVVIDDPISSLDSASIYQAFSFLKDAVRDAKQFFIFTHNYDFLKILLNWAKYAKVGDPGYFMIVCLESETSRDAQIHKMDSLLLKHSTEYSFLFKVLYEFESDGTIINSYHIPNVARKVLETFLEFQSPYEKNPFRRLESIKFDSQKKDAIYKFTNDLSHPTGRSFDPALVSETQKNIGYLLEMIKEVAPDHYEGLERLVRQGSTG